MISILATSRSGHHWVGSVIKSWFTDENVDYLTNTLPTDLKNHKLGEKRVIVIRDFPNFLASMLKAYLDTHGVESSWRIAADRKIEAYDAILDEAAFPKYFKANVVISYSFFTQSRKYRQEICKALGGRYNEEELDVVSEEGSSFDGHSFEGIGNKMTINQRYLQIADTPWDFIYTNILNEKRSKIIMDKWNKTIQASYGKFVF